MPVPDSSERDLNLLNGNYDIYVILSLVSIAIPIMYDFVLLGCTFAFTKPYPHRKDTFKFAWRYLFLPSGSSGL